MENTDNVRRDIELQIAHHSDAIINLKTHWNTLSPISRLPTELLAEVFILHARDRGLHALYYKKYGMVLAGAEKRYTWIRVAQVCRHWRAVALNCPRLWNHIYVTSPKWMEMLLPRTRKAPLSVEVDTVSGPYANERLPALKAVLQHMGRVEALQLSIHTSQLKELKEEFDKAAGSLRSLEIHMVGSSDHVHTHYPATLFQAQHPHLQRIVLSNVPTIRWSDTLFCPTVTELSLKASIQVAGVTMSAMLAALEGMPLLRTLDLWNVLPSNAFSNTSDLRTVALPQLRTLKVSGDTLSPETCAVLLNHISIPTLSTVDIRCSPIDHAIGLVAPLAANLQGTSSISALSLDGDTYHICLRAWTSQFLVNGAEHDIPTSDPDISLEIFSGDVAALGPGVLLDFCQNLPLIDVRALRLQLAGLSREQWEKLLTPLSNTTLAEIAGYPHPTLSNALSSHMLLHEKDLNPFLLPRLHTLRFKNSSFIPRRYSLSEKPPPDPLVAFLDCLKERKKEGTGIKRITLDYCTVRTSEDETAIKDLVDNLILHSLDVVDDREEDEDDDELVYEPDYFEDDVYDYEDNFDYGYDGFGCLCPMCAEG